MPDQASSSGNVLMLDLRQLAFIKILLQGFVILGILLILFSTWLSHLNSSTKSWSKVDGNILSITTHSVLSGSSDVLNVDVLYSYDFENRKFENQRTRYGLVASSSEYFGLKNGDKISVFVNPFDPAESVLQTGTAFSDFVFMILGVFCVGIPGIALKLIFNVGPKPNKNHGG